MVLYALYTYAYMYVDLYVSIQIENMIVFLGLSEGTTGGRRWKENMRE
jgi:hypothetical protein